MSNLLGRTFGEAFPMRVVKAPAALATIFLLLSAGSPQAAPAVPREPAVSAPAITTVRQRCGTDLKRGPGAWQDKHGAWHGSCVPKRKMAGPSGYSTPSGGTANELNAQEL